MAILGIVCIIGLLCIDIRILEAANPQLAWTDPELEDNFLVQCHGTKRVCLFPPECHGQLYVNTKYDSGTRCCDVDVFNPEPR